MTVPASSPAIATAGLLYLASRLGTLTTWLNFRWLLFLGSISYSLYLIHNPITGAFYRVAYRLTGHGLGARDASGIAPMVAVNVDVRLRFLVAIRADQHGVWPSRSG